MYGQTIASDRPAKDATAAQVASCWNTMVSRVAGWYRTFDSRPLTFLIPISTKALVIGAPFLSVIFASVSPAIKASCQSECHCHCQSRDRNEIGKCAAPVTNLLEGTASVKF